jgi:hypothetical protein
MSRDADKERARRIRQAQIANRDPGDSKIRGYDWDRHYQKKRKDDRQKKRAAERPLVVVLWDSLPTRWRGFAYGLLVGTIIGIIVIFILPSEWRPLIVVPQGLGMILGLVIGKAMEEPPLK